MTFSLHAGWGIEGAIGSKHKIDASYLSPSVGGLAIGTPQGDQYLFFFARSSGSSWRSVKLLAGRKRKGGYA